MLREHGEDGEFVETVTLEDVLETSEHVRGPVIPSGDVADWLGCSRGEDRHVIGRQVLEWFRGTESYVSAAEVKAALYSELTYADESADTWWRKLGRPPLKAAVDAGLAEYRAGYHDYRWLGEAGDRDDDVDEEDGGSSSSGVYDPTEEF